MYPPQETNDKQDMPDRQHSLSTLDRDIYPTTLFGTSGAPLQKVCVCSCTLYVLGKGKVGSGFRDSINFSFKLSEYGGSVANTSVSSAVLVLESGESDDSGGGVVGTVIGASAGPPDTKFVSVS
jgi:hypothetical protein